MPGLRLDAKVAWVTGASQTDMTAGCATKSGGAEVLRGAMMVAGMTRGHPTLSEGVAEAARAADGWLIHG